MLTLSQPRVIETRTPAPSLAVCFAVGALWSLLGATVGRGLTLGAFVLAGRFLGSTGFGEVGMVQSTQGLFGVLAGTSLGLTATKFVAEHRSIDRLRAGRCVMLTNRIAVIGGLGAAAVLWVLSPWVATTLLHAPQLVVELRIGTGLIVFGAINGVQTGALLGMGEFRAVAVIGILRGACLFVFLLAGVVAAGVLGGVLGLVLTEAAMVIASGFALRRLFPEGSTASQAEASSWCEVVSLCRFSGLAVLGSIATTSASWLGNVLLVGQHDGYAALGVFNAADKWRQLLLFLPASLSPIILSLLSNLHGKSDAAAYRNLLFLNLGISVAVVLLPSLGLIALAPFAMSIFGQEYQGGSTTLIILAASALAATCNNLLGQVLVSKGAIWWRTVLDFVLAAVLALVCWQMIPLYQDRGLALANLLAFAVTSLALLAPVAWYLRAPTKRLAPSQE